MRIFWCAILITLFLITAPDTSRAKDITQQVRNQTNLDEMITQACVDQCQGNQRQGSLTRVTIDRSGDQTFEVRGEANFRNYHVEENLVVLGQRIEGGLTLFDYTIVIIAEGVLDAKTCKLRINNVKIKNDPIGLSSLARQEEGKIYDLANCNNFMSDL